jgi:hypothetical protein
MTETTAQTFPAGHCYPSGQHVVEQDERGITRFRRNRIIDDLVNAARDGRVGPDLNGVAIGVARGRYTIEERGELNRLIGYSISGFEDAFPPSDERPSGEEVVEDRDVTIAELKAEVLRLRELIEAQKVPAYHRGGKGTT